MLFLYLNNSNCMKFILLISALLQLLFSFGQKKKSPLSVKRNFITSLKVYQGNDTLFKSKHNHLYKLTFIRDEELKSLASPMTCTSNSFAGTARKLSKTSIASAHPQIMTFQNFIQSLPADKLMTANPSINSSPNNPRVNQENRNISLSGIYLFGIKRESDNDYHLIIGDKTGKYFNVEISGLPLPSSTYYQALLKARAQADTYFGKPNCNQGGYAIFAQGIKIQLSGSTFYDIDHAPGTVGPQGYKPTTSWEIHPVTDIKFLQ